MKLTKCRFFRVSVLCLMLLSLVSVAAAAGYSADVVTTGNSGTNHAKMWVSYSLWAQRMEMPAHPEMIMIVRLDKKLVWNINKESKMYMEIPMRPGMAANAIASGEKAPTEVERTYLLTETVEGHVADKYQITHQIGNDRTTHFIWLLKDNNMFPIKTQYKDSVTVFKNLNFTEPPAEMFEVPPGYQKMALPFMP
ncbi:MAG: hypothetical protein GYA36_13335 [Veillonellaceae bacterium]|nr:hypothetical protein [Veillonellaceae bacterium]